MTFSRRPALRQHRKIGANREGRDFVVGDIHGQMGRLRQRLDEVAFSPERDRLFAVGDLVDRGPESAAVLDLLELPWFFSVAGNHEMMLLDSLTRPDIAHIHRLNGGEWFHALEREHQLILADRILQHCTLTLTIDSPSGTVGLVHATAPSDWRVLEDTPLDPAHQDTLLWDREDYRRARQAPDTLFPVRNVDWVVQGHVSCEKPVRATNRCWIDTLYRGNGLTLAPLSDLHRLKDLAKARNG
ncbi:metallophosphoesterase [Mangrovitalea sediminis]|uniref:metallophosphoesterase n=1 Tax=Mangrovitalea sediminis TaxID=1982043 RepID=UPI0013047098|nr:metallophosphoesterase [Mangrovitalea sediminis]